MQQERFTIFIVTGCITAFVAYIIRKRIDHERTLSTEQRLMANEIDKEIQQNTALTDVELAQPTRARKLSYDKDGQPILVVGVCGGTGSGKTTLARSIIDNYGEEKVTYITHDYYYKDLKHVLLEDRSKHNYDHPDSLDTNLLIEHLELLRRGETVDLPQYDFATHTRRNESVTTVPRNVILLEGILIFADAALVKLMDIKIFVDTPDDIRFIRRLRRDMQDRGRTAECVMVQYLKTVRPMHKTFVEPSKRNADILVPQGVNVVALEMILSRLRSFTSGLIRD